MPVGSVSENLVQDQPGQGLVVWMAIAIAGTAFDNRYARFCLAQKLRGCGSSGTVVSHLEQHNATKCSALDQILLNTWADITGQEC